MFAADAAPAVAGRRSFMPDRPDRWTRRRLRGDTAAMLDTMTPADPLGEALHFLRMSGTFYCRSEFTAPWTLGLPAMDSCLMLHVVTSGECRLETGGAEPCTLRTGDL